MASVRNAILLGFVLLLVGGIPGVLAQDGDPGTPDLILTHGDAHIIEVAWNPDGTLIATRGADHLVRVWDAQTGAEQLTIDVTDHVEQPGDFQNEWWMGWTADGTRFWLAWHGNLLILDAVTGEPFVHIDYGYSPASVPIGHRWSH